VLPSGQALGFQQMQVGEQDADSTLDNALSMAPMFSLNRKEAVREVRAVVRVVDTWRVHFKACGVSRGDIDSYAEQLDRPFLLNQRAQFRAARR
jgi:serine/threonine-protein kinase HipA